MLKSNNIRDFAIKKINYIVVVLIMILGAILFRSSNPAVPFGFFLLYTICIIVQIIYLIKATVSVSMKMGTFRIGGYTIGFYFLSAAPVYALIYVLLLFDMGNNTRLVSNIFALTVLLIYVIPFRIKRRSIVQNSDVLHTPNITDASGKAAEAPIIIEDEYENANRPVKNSYSAKEGGIN